MHNVLGISITFSITTIFTVFQIQGTVFKELYKLEQSQRETCMEYILLLNHWNTVRNYTRSVDKKDVKYQINTDKSSVLTYVYLKHISVRVNMAADTCILIMNFSLY